MIAESLRQPQPRIMPGMASPPTSFDIVVAGRGIAGSAMALGAAQLGLRVAQVGPPPLHVAPGTWDIRVYAIAPAVMRLLERLRVAGQVDRSRIEAVHEMRIHGDATSRRGELQFTAYGASLPELAWIMEAAELQRVLDLGGEMQASLTRLDGQVKSQATVDAADASQPLQVMLEDGRVIETSLLVAADGARSAIRAQAGISGPEHTYGQHGVVAHFDCEYAHGGVASQWFQGDAILALLPLPDPSTAPQASRRVSMVWSLPDDRAHEVVALSAEALSAQVERAAEGVLGTMTLWKPAAAFPLRYFKADELVQPRLALVGDAAHQMHPLAGQGINTGLQDVQALLDVLAAREPFRDIGDLRLLRRYARARAEPVALMMHTTDALHRLFAQSQPGTVTLRNLGMNWLNQVPALKHRLIRQAVGA
jgi:ubiquinone biosynthesis UbiH/UbiF/VisC/COQ6 family hydroxylase